MVNAYGIRPVYLIAGGAVVLALLWVNSKGAAGTGKAIGSAAVALADGAITGTVTAIGGLVGVPLTSQKQCQKDRAAGDTWAASFSCPAIDFIKYAL